MDDQQQPTTYPGFDISAESLKMLHTELGRRIHECVERELRESHLRAELQALLNRTEAANDNRALINGVLDRFGPGIADLDDSARPADVAGRGG